MVVVGGVLSRRRDQKAWPHTDSFRGNLQPGDIFQIREGNSRVTRTLRQRGRERRRPRRLHANAFFCFLAQVEENAKETLGDDDDACCADGHRRLSATQREITHILFQNTDFSFVKNKKQKRG